MQTFLARHIMCRVMPYLLTGLHFTTLNTCLCVAQQVFFSGWLIWVYCFCLILFFFPNVYSCGFYWCAFYYFSFWMNWNILLRVQKRKMISFGFVMMLSKCFEKFGKCSSESYIWGMKLLSRLWLEQSSDHIKEHREFDTLMRSWGRD